LVTLLVAAIGIVPLPAPGSGSTRLPAIALAPVAANADSEYRPALRLATYSQPKNSVPVNASVGHFRDYAINTTGSEAAKRKARRDDRTDD